jgi:hypothetical protein
VPSALIQSLNPLIGDFINTIDPKRTLADQFCCDAQQRIHPADVVGFGSLI